MTPGRRGGWHAHNTPTTSRLCSTCRETVIRASMRVDGRWHLFKDGISRPVIDAAVQTPSGSWQPVMMLLDAGADRTVFDASFLPILAPTAVLSPQSPQLR